MPSFGKICRLLLIAVFLAPFSPVDAGLKVNLGKIFERGSQGNTSSVSPDVADASDVADRSELADGSDVADEEPAAPKAAGRGEYLQVARTVEVDYEADAKIAPSELVETFPVVTLVKKAPPSYSEFLKQMEDARQAAEEADALADGQSSSGPQAAEPTGASPAEMLGRSDIVNNSETAVDAAGGSAAASGANEEMLVVEAGGGSLATEVSSIDRTSPRLFSRHPREEMDLSKVFLFYPSDGFDADQLGNYNILTPIDRFDLFTPPAQVLPKSSVRYRSVP